ncbi:MAG: hypothetical protein KBS44_05140, partial [Clostridiales bacterium]|nr:hypothetical protein [Candidatus Coliplasma equi]
MSIQLNVVIWTVINFCLLMLVLNFLLFKPLLAFMDKRNAKIENAKNLVSERENKKKEAEAFFKAENERKTL